MASVSNIVFDEIEIGQSAEYQKTVTEQDIQLFAAVSGDTNPVHLDESYAQTTPFAGRIAHGMLTGAHVSAALATKLPGPGTIYLNQSIKFKHPVRIDDTLTTVLTVSKKRDDRKFVTLDCKVSNQNGEIVAAGEAMVIAPTEKMTIEMPTLPSIKVG